MSEAPPVIVSRSGAVGVIELARPDKFNCLSLAVHAALEAAIDDFEKPGSGVRAVLIRAQGKHFCTGADLEEVKSLRSDPAKIEHFIRYGHGVLRRLEASPLPIVAACQGLVLAGGTELMLACDVILPPRTRASATSMHSLAWCRAGAAASASRASWACAGAWTCSSPRAG